MIIDPLKAVIAYALADPAGQPLLNGRIASDHHFGDLAPDGWPQPSKALTLNYDGGLPQIYLPKQTPRLEARCYGESKAEAGRVYRWLIGLSRSLMRVRAVTDDGAALIYRLLPDSGPSALRDPDLNIDYIMVFLTAAVAEVDIP